ncbi:diacylglycerol/lipid kinase family protein [Jeotgalibacillus haloalkalitolerans]|uniref:YegS/Rv2252/BmrU family lipid kinase n=1 Tax=Jeotgalibacillus haloalkalitolerans TaxID=3104292 RepID=A0ABU5KMN1_9BACL|nr:YegS/Rv2252/BmrU family lipid kinase [Jeotgalibacillus sp. HH7-29]MDZ5712522.1 YegS/Rv2252/BmrU family lipid kinase [Jeotgalibacillus sp. HH7-29]
MKKIAVFNPNAGKGINRHQLSALLPALQIAGIEVWMTRSKHDAEQRIREWCVAHPCEEVCFIISGGDGTMHEAVNGAAGHKHAVFASIPAGSGNDFARYFGGFDLNASLPESLEQVQYEWHDVIRYEMNETRTAVSNMGAGFDAEVAYAANHSRIKKFLNKLSIGKAVYVVFLVRLLISFRPYTLELKVNGEKQIYSRVWFMTISNQPYFGGGMKIAPSADTKDGELDITVVHGLSRLKFLLVFGSVFRGTHTKFKEVSVIRSGAVICHSDQDVRVHADGEDNGLLKAGQSLKAAAAPFEIRTVNKLTLDES